MQSKSKEALFLQTKISSFPKITKNTAKLLEKKNINTLEDLLEEVPLRYEDWSLKQPEPEPGIANLQKTDGYSPEPRELKVGEQVDLNQPINLLVEIMTEAKVKYTPKGPLITYQALILPENILLANQVIELSFFNQLYLQKQIKKDMRLHLHGKLKKGYYHRLSMVMPKWKYALDSKMEERVEKKQEILPIYRKIKGLSQNMMKKSIKAVLTAIEEGITTGEFQKENFENLPQFFIQKYPLSPYIDRLSLWQQIHCFKKDTSDRFSFSLLRQQLALRELFFFKLALGSGKKSEKKEAAFKFIFDQKIKRQFLSCLQNLPFTLTKNQQDIIGTIIEEFLTNRRMNRLLQGDVGSGKTIIAVLAALVWILQDKQVLLMAPTSVLANQLYQEFTKFYQNLERKIRVELLIGSTGEKKSRQIKDDFWQGKIDILIGTTALLNADLKSERLALVITDEQHRFGVRQRQMLKEKMQGFSEPHVLAMTATPIPRSLALVLYGDMDVSQLQEKPKNRPARQTYTVKEADFPRVFKLMEEELAKDNYIYIICPRKEAEEELDFSSSLSLTTADSDLEVKKKTKEKQGQNLYDVYTFAALLKQQEKIAKYGLAVLHGSLKTKEKEAVMADFLNGKIRVLISTTVVEVGVNQPKANFMLILHADRFGLATLHQLRGRIGRGEQKDSSAQRVLCLLHNSASPTNQIAKERLKAICQSDDGFFLAQRDLEIRGPGDFFGLLQHGLPPFKIANLYEDMEILLKLNDCLMESNIKICNVEEKQGIERQLKRQFGDFYDSQTL